MKQVDGSSGMLRLRWLTAVTAVASVLGDGDMRTRLGETAARTVARYDVGVSATALGDLYRRAAGAVMSPRSAGVTSRL